MVSYAYHYTVPGGLTEREMDIDVCVFLKGKYKCVGGFSKIYLQEY